MIEVGSRAPWDGDRMVIHLCADNIVPLGKVAIDCGEGLFKFVPFHEAESEKIIRCFVPDCLESAIVIDHLWPYYSEHCRCETHRG